jgi:3-oxoadipate enol-lactonase
MPVLRVNGIDLYCEDSGGGGEAMVLVMGLGGDHVAWGFQVPALAERYRVVTFDNRGAGRSSQPDEPYSIAGMAADTVGLMDALGIERAHVVGASMGGMIAQELALAHPARVRSLQLWCTMARPDAWMLALLRSWRTVRTTLSFEAAFRAMALWLFAPATFAERPQLVEMVVQGAIANPFPQSVTGFLRQCDAVAGHDALERLPGIACPTLVAVGEADALVPPRFSREIAARIPRAELRLLAGAGHVCFWERAEAFNARVLEFAAAHGARAPPPRGGGRAPASRHRRPPPRRRDPIDRGAAGGRRQFQR